MIDLDTLMYLILVQMMVMHYDSEMVNSLAQHLELWMVSHLVDSDLDDVQIGRASSSRAMIMRW